MGTTMICKAFAAFILLLIAGAIVALCFLLRPYFAGERIIDPVFVQIGRLEIRWFGVMNILAFVMGISVAFRMAKRWGIKPFNVFIIPIVCALMVLICARLFSCVIHRDYYLSHPLQILYVWDGPDLSLNGAALGGVLGCLIYALVSRLPMLRIMDLCAVPLVLIHAMGSWGNFFKQEGYGCPTDLPWKMYITPHNRLDAYQGFSYFHPVFLYEFIADLLLVTLMLWCARKKNLAAGVITGLYLLCYGLIRLVVDFARITESSDGILTWLRVEIVITMLVGGAILLFVNRRERLSGSVGR